MGSTQALKNSQTSDSILVGTGIWNSKAVLGNAYHTQDESAELSAALRGPPTSTVSEGECPSIRSVVRKRAIRLPRNSRRLPTVVDDRSGKEDDLTSEYTTEAEYP